MTDDIFSPPQLHDETSAALGAEDTSGAGAEDTSGAGTEAKATRRARKPRSSGGSRPRAARPSNRTSKTVVLGIIEKYEQIGGLDQEQFRFLAASLGLPPEAEPKDIVAEVYASASGLNPVAIVDKLRAIEDPVERYIAALSLSKPEQKSVWNLLSGVTEVSGRLPADERQAAKKLTDALSKVDEITFFMLGDLKALGSR